MRLKKILLAEDDLLDAELTMSTLVSIPISNEIVHFEDGEDILDYLFCRNKYGSNTFEEPAMIILDIKMPKVDGLEVLRIIKGEDRFKHIPTIILTSSKQNRDVEDSYENGANAYVVKPVDMDQFQDAVKTLGLFWALVNHTE